MHCSLSEKNNDLCSVFLPLATYLVDDFRSHISGTEMKPKIVIAYDFLLNISLRLIQGLLSFSEK